MCFQVSWSPSLCDPLHLLELPGHKHCCDHNEVSFFLLFFFYKLLLAFLLSVLILLILTTFQTLTMNQALCSGIHMGYLS